MNAIKNGWHSIRLDQSDKNGAHMIQTPHHQRLAQELLDAGHHGRRAAPGRGRRARLQRFDGDRNGATGRERIAELCTVDVPEMACKIGAGIICLSI